ncbi:cytochrome P450 [Cristinia sonorae]|uniref:Cytochrome P450 n=1 Tax=Cristinia sonorae TaxID=1940300 RepID=A0A8K0XTZ8_9AGAR|nr:cytochrome P450 [Cristinia sonorae]
MPQHPFSRYRLRILQDFVRIFVFPILLLSLAFKATGIRLGLLAVPVHFAFIVLCAFARDWYGQLLQRQEAYKMGGRVVPQVKGKWPGNIDVMLRIKNAAHNDYLCQGFLDLFQEYQSTTLNLRILGADLMITMDEEHIKFLSATGFNHFWRGRRQKERMETFLGAGIFNRDDDSWKVHRSMARPFFSRDRVTDFELFERHSDKALSVISSLASAKAPIEVQDLFARYTLDTAAEALFGERIDSMNGTLPVPGQTSMSAKGSLTTDDFGAFAQAFEMAQEVIVGRTHKGYFWPALQLFKDDVQPHMEVIDKWIEPIIARVLSNKAQMRKAGLSTKVEHSTFLEYLAENTEDPQVIKDQLLNVLLAGRDTTAALLTFVTYMMAMHPEVARKMRAEVLQHIGEHNAPTCEAIKSLRYMHAVINETLRLFPPVPQNIRECRDEPIVFPQSDATFPTSADEPSLYVPANTPILFVPMWTQRNPVHWGPDADVFDPDRWLDERLSRFVENPMIFTPFGAGPRICIGQSYARNETSYFLVRLLQQFDTFTLAPEFQPEGSLPPSEWKNGSGRKRIEQIRPAYALTLYVKGGLWMRFGRASDSDS